ncbi:MAG TPA: hypothetical protein DCZ11_04500 [Gammaproteobacteria bacterium]|nr:hypothetical protein [Gammaproteobacteria bacterium]MCH77686.1 hypothetical protein [Gammaproteobacteria bacterium]
MRVSDVLRLVAMNLPMSDAERWSPYRSRFICDQLTGFAPVAAPPRDRVRALAHLFALGMGSGLDAFRGSITFNRAEQHERKAWLLFAADLWDEGVR